MELVAFDIGNGYCSACDEKYTASLKSIYHIWREGERTPSDNENKATVGDTLFILGDDCKRYRDYENVAENNKSNLVLPFTLALLNMLGKRTVDAVFQVPDPLRYEASLRSALEGTGINVRNVYQEGYGSWYEFRKMRLQPKAKGISLVIDIGAGTTVASLIDESTTMVLDTFVKESAGCVYLCQLLAEDRRLVQTIGEHPSISDLMQGIEHEDNEYGDTGISFAQYLPAAQDAWFKWLFNIIRSHYKAYMNRITSIIFTGGGSLLLKDRIENNKSPLIHLAASPLGNNLTGIYNHAKSIER